MGLLGGLMGQMAGQMLGGKSGMLGVAKALFEQNGGLSGFLQKFQQAGFAEQVASWVGTDANLPISADQVVKALGSGNLADLAKQFDLSSDQISSGLSKHLPNLVDSLTPDGKIDDNPLSMDKIGGLLAGLLK